MKIFQKFLLVVIVSGLWLATPCLQAGMTFTTLVSLNGTNGANPVANLVQGPDGNLFGTAPNGGASTNGTIFEISSDGSFFTNLYNFTGGSNGASPAGALIVGRDGNLYGTTFSGGISNSGTVFQLSTNGTLNQLGAFGRTNGSNPNVGLTESPDGSFYGTTAYGGPYPNATSGGTGYGVIFRITTNRVLSTVVILDSTNGANATALVPGTNGNFYGTTAWGGSIGSFHLGFGTIYRLSPDGTFTNLHIFSGGNDGGFPYANLMEAHDGNLYGTTYNGSTNSLGSVFRMTPSGEFETLHAFTGGADGGFPYAGLVQASDGSFYGTTYLGGTYGYGTVFEMYPDGNLIPLFSFTGATGAFPGAHPYSSLVQASDGNFYGTTYDGGTYNKGTVFRLSLPLPPVFESITRTNGTVTLVWSSVATQAYQLQYSTNLAQGNWNNLGKTAIATNGIMTASDTVGTDRQRFYQVVLQ